MVTSAAAGAPRQQEQLCEGVEAVASPKRSRVRRSSGPLGVASAALLFFGCLVGPRLGQLDDVPFFDEMWRLDLIHSRDVLATSKLIANTTAVPYGWIYANKALIAVFGDSLPVLRLAGLVFWTLALVVLLLTFVRVTAVGSRLRHRPVTVAVVATCATLAVTGSLTELTGYANNYVFDVLLAALLLYASTELDRSRWAFPALLVIIATMPLFTLPALVLLPAAIARAVWWARKVGRPALALLAGASVVSAGTAAVAYVELYRPVVGRPASIAFLADWWRPDRLQSGSGGPLLLGRTASLIRSAIWPGAAGIGHPVLSVVLWTSFVYGLLVLIRWWPWSGVFLASGWVGILLLCATTGAPVTPVRVTVGFYFLVLATVIFGFFAGVAFMTELLTRGRGHQVPFVAIAVSVLAFMWPRLTTPGRLFSLVREFDVVATSRATANLVIAYHFLAQPYADDRLGNGAPPGRFIVLAERHDDRSLYGPLDELVATKLARGGAVWCVVPYALGPVDSDRACRFNLTRQLVRSFHGPQAEVVEYRI